MVKKKLTITEPQKKVLFPVVTGSLLIIGLFYIVSSSLVQLNQLNTAIRNTNRKIKAVAKLKKLSKVRKETLQLFPVLKQKNDIISAVASWARSEGLGVDNIEPEESELAGTDFVRMTLSINGSGGFLKMLRFLKKIDAAPYFLLVTHVDLSGFDLRTSRRRYRRDGEDQAVRSFDVTIDTFLLRSEKQK